MYKASFFDGTLKESEAKEFITQTDKPLKYTHGLKFRNPTTLRVPISKVCGKRKENGYVY